MTQKTTEPRRNPGQADTAPAPAPITTGTAAADGAMSDADLDTVSGGGDGLNNMTAYGPVGKSNVAVN